MEIRHFEIKLARATTLPILPNVVAQALQLMERPSATAHDYERIICQDAALASKILRTANSAYYNHSSEVTTIYRAIMQLGQGAIRSICLTVAFQSALENKKLDKRFKAVAFWRHSLAVACASKVIAHVTGHPQTEEAFLAGLVHDIGKLAMWMFLPNEAHRVYDLVERLQMPHYDAEMKILQVTHQEIGRMAAERWRLPDIYLAPISQHHTPIREDGECDMLTAFVHVGNALADEVGYAISPPGEINQAQWEVSYLLGIEEEQLIPIREAVRQSIAALGRQLNL